VAAGKPAAFAAEAQNIHVFDEAGQAV
jgi:hypothetical protein